MKNIGLLLVSVILALLLSTFTFRIYNNFFPAATPGGLFASYAAFGSIIIGFFVAFTIVLNLLFTSFGDKYKYWWIGILLLPVLWFVIKLDLAHWYFYAALAVVGWAIGTGIRKIIPHKKPN